MRNAIKIERDETLTEKVWYNMPNIDNNGCCHSPSLTDQRIEPVQEGYLLITDEPDSVDDGWLHKLDGIWVDWQVSCEWLSNFRLGVPIWLTVVKELPSGWEEGWAGSSEEFAPQ